MHLERDTRVRLIDEIERIPAGTEGIVLGFKTEPQAYLVQFADYGTHEVPMDAVEPVPNEG
jgi:hypothetical protein